MTHLHTLNGRKDVVIDTMFFIYLFEDTPRYGEHCESIIEMIAEGSFSALITPITAAEIVVKPIFAGRNELADEYFSALKRIKNTRLASISVETGHIAGALKAKYRLPLPDMIQMAVALQTEKPAIITNDKALKKVTEVKVYLLDDMI